MRRIKYLLILLPFLVDTSCSESNGLKWEEAGFNAKTPIKEGISAFNGTVINYTRNGKKALTVNFGEPVVVAIAQKPEGWGYFQFPSIRYGKGNILVVGWSMAADAVESYGKGGGGVAISKDGGKTWSPPRGENLAGGGTLLSNGDRIAVHTPKALKVEDLELPDSVDSRKENYGRTFVLYKMNDLPDELQGVYLNRMAAGSNSWVTEHAVLNDPAAVRYTDSGWFPVVWWGDLRIASDKSVITGIYPGFYLDENDGVPPSGVCFYRSTDYGRTWTVQGRIPYVPDVSTDPNGNKRYAFGYTEPAFEILSNGTFLCVMRTSDGLGNSPMYLSTSDDMGTTWTKPVTFTRSGVLPKLLQLKNGVVVLSAGRPGVQLRFSTDGKGEEWTDPFEMLPFENTKDDVSCGYTQLLATGPDKFLLVYSDFKYTNKEGEIRKAIKVREIRVSPE